MVEKGIMGGKCHAVHQYLKTNRKAKNYDKNKESSYHNLFINYHNMSYIFIYS